jgi:ComF family protein
MDWQCERTGGVIEVSLNNQHLGSYVLIKRPFCERCGTPETDFASCHRTHAFDWFDSVFTVGVYYQKHLHRDEMLTDHILRLKSDPTYKEPLGRSMGIVAREIFPELLKADGLVPIPLHCEELKKRGFNQSLELSNQLSIETGIPVVDAVEKTKPKSLQGLSFMERYREVEGLYKIKQSDIEGKEFIIVDDVRASGATCSESSKVLKQAGAKSVKVFVLGTTKYSRGS